MYGDRPGGDDDPGRFYVLAELSLLRTEETGLNDEDFYTRELQTARYCATHDHLDYGPLDSSQSIRR